MSLGNRIISLRNSLNLSRKDLSEKINISYSALSKYETDERFPDKEILNKFSDFFDVSTDYLLERTNIKKYEIPHIAFHATEGLSKEDIELVNNLIERLKEKHKK